MLDSREIDWAINQIESDESSVNGYILLSALYNIRDRMFDSEYKLHSEPVQKTPEAPRNMNNYSNSNGKLTRDEAQKWASSMRNEDGTTGGHWPMEQTDRVMAQRGISGSPIDFYIAMNMIYSDYSQVFRKYGVGEKLDLYVDMAKAFLDDKDSNPNKLSLYYENIVK